MSLYSIETMSVSRTVSEIFSVKEWRDIETAGRSRSRSLKMAPFELKIIQLSIGCPLSVVPFSSYLTFI